MVFLFCCFLIQVLSEELSCNADEILSIELNVCDTQPSCLGGGNNEFIFSGRLDNLASSYCALRSLLDSCNTSGDLANEQAIRMVALFDNEEVLAIRNQFSESFVWRMLYDISLFLTHTFLIFLILLYTSSTLFPKLDHPKVASSKNLLTNSNLSKDLVTRKYCINSLVKTSVQIEFDKVLK